MLRKCLTNVLNSFLKSERKYIHLQKMDSEMKVSVKRELEVEDNAENLSKKQKLLESSDDAVKVDENVKHLRKPKKVILLLCYLGKDFFGMQRNANVLTVEEALFKALLQANIILKSEFDFPKTMKFQRAARTDKGVSAARQIVSLKIPLKEISNMFPTKVNEFLPPEIRVLGIKRVTQSFDAKIACDARTYAYMFPTFAFSPPENEDIENYKINDERLNEVNKFLQYYVGTHDFYNFTSGRLPGDPSCKRYIMSCECGPPFESYNLEFSIIKIKGQSFMLHQIRKMVGLAIAYMRKLADSSVLEKAWQHQRIDIPKAPGLGLILEDLHYDWYNTKFGSDGMHEPLKWDEYDELVNKFKEEQICANIAKTEREEKSMLQWLETLPYHSYDIREAGPPSDLKSAKLTKHELPENSSNNCEEGIKETNTNALMQKNDADKREIINDICNLDAAKTSPQTEKDIESIKLEATQILSLDDNSSKTNDLDIKVANSCSSHCDNLHQINSNSKAKS